MVEIFYDRGKKELLLATYIFSKEEKCGQVLKVSFYIYYLHPLNYLQIQIQMQKMNF